MPRTTTVPSPSPPATASGAPVRRRRILLGGVLAAWLATLAVLAHGELRDGVRGADARALLDAAGIGHEHDTARHSLHLGRLEVGSLTASVSGTARARQLAYSVEGQVVQPERMRLRIAVLASWDRRLERFVADLDVAGTRYRLDGAVAADPTTSGVRLDVAWSRGQDEVGKRSWPLPSAPRLAPGPLPIPDLAPLLAALTDGAAAGAPAIPTGGDDSPSVLRVRREAAPGFVAGGRPREAIAHHLRHGPHAATLWTDLSGRLLRADLPGGLSLHLVSDTPPAASKAVSTP